jgi:PAS domain S-box-containing protein
MAVLVTALLLVAAGAQSALSYVQLRQVLLQAAEVRLRGLARQWESVLGKPMLDASARLTRLASDTTLTAALARGASPSARAGVLASLQSFVALERRGAVALIDAAGRPVAEAGPAGQPAWFGTPAAAHGARVAPYARLNDSTFYYDLRVPVQRAGTLAGTLVLRTRTPLAKATPATLGALLGESTRLVIGSPATGVWMDLGEFLPALPLAALRADTLSRFMWEGETQVGVARAFSGTTHLLVVLAPQAAVMAPAQVFLRRAILVALLTLLVGGIGAVFLGRWLNRPLEQVTAVAAAITSGEHSRRADELAPGEVGPLARSFNAMVDQVTQSEARYRLLAENARDIVSLQDASGKLLYVSPSTETLLGYRPESLLGDSVVSLVHPEDLERRENARLEVLREGGAGAASCTYRVRRSNGKWAWIEVLYRRTLLPKGQSYGILSAARDITERKCLEEQFLQAQKLEAVGRLAGGVAHDFNNLLTAIVGSVDAAQEQLPKEHPAQQHLTEIDLVSRRAAGLTRQLLSFSRHQVVNVEVLDLNAVLQGLDSLLRRVIGEDVQLVTKTADRLPPVRADEGQLGQVLLNLVVNARDAMPTGGRLTIETQAVELDAEYARAHDGVVPGRYVLLAVTDTGTGIPAEVTAHLFEPFFTTKPVGRGTGLGLATCFGIVAAAGGHLWYYTEPGIGTTFKVYLPQVVDEAVAVAAPVAQADPGGTETVLVVEDEPAVRRVTLRMLQSMGYSVIEAHNGAAALQTISEASAPVDLVVTDMVMPEMSGAEMVSTLHLTQPNLRVLFLSGYAEEALSHNGRLEVGLHFLQKPFSRADLARAVRKALSGERAA